MELIIRQNSRNSIPEYIKLQEIRAVVHATGLVCDYHNRVAPKAIKLLLTKDKPVWDDDACWGTAQVDRNLIKVWAGIPTKSDFITVLIHEVLHLCAWHEGGQERPTSTLTGRLKPLIVRIADEIAVGLQQRAAWFAHCKISYARTKENDSYNYDQWTKAETKGTSLPQWRKNI